MTHENRRLSTGSRTYSRESVSQGQAIIDGGQAAPSNSIYENKVSHVDTHVECRRTHLDLSRLSLLLLAEQPVDRPGPTDLLHRGLVRTSRLYRAARTHR